MSLRTVVRMGEGVHLALVGRRLPTWDPASLVRGGSLSGRLTVSTNVSDEDFLGWLHAADVVADLRFHIAVR